MRRQKKKDINNQIHFCSCILNILSTTGEKQAPNVLEACDRLPVSVLQGAWRLYRTAMAASAE